MHRVTTNMLGNKNTTLTQLREEKIQLQLTALLVMTCATLNHLSACARHAVKSTQATLPTPPKACREKNHKLY